MNGTNRSFDILQTGLHTYFIQNCSLNAELYNPLRSAPDCRSRCREFEYQPEHKTFAKIDHEMFSAAIKEGLLSVNGKVCALSTGKPLR